MTTQDHIAADIQCLLSFIFKRFGAPGDAGELPDDVVAAVRRLERIPRQPPTDSYIYAATVIVDQKARTMALSGHIAGSLPDGPHPLYAKLPAAAAESAEPDYKAAAVETREFGAYTLADTLDPPTAATAAGQRVCDSVQVAQGDERPIPADCDVRKILLRIVPGDGNGHEVYARNVSDVEKLLSEMGERLEDFELARDAMNARQQSGGDAALLERAQKAEAECARLDALINNPQTAEFLEAVRTEAAHQRERWGDAHDRSKSAENWYWLVGYLAGKCLRAHIAGDQPKALHHTISTAAALAQWYDAIARDDSAAGIGQDADLVALDAGRARRAEGGE